MAAWHTRARTSFGKARKPQSTVQGFGDTWSLEGTVQVELMVPARLGNGVARHMLEQSGDDLPRLGCAAEKGEARRAVAKRGRDIGALAKDARSAIHDFFMIAHAKICNRVSHIPGQARVQWIEALDLLQMLDRPIDLALERVEKRAHPKRIGIVAIETYGLLH